MQCVSSSVSSQQCSKKASASLLWLLKSSGIIADRPWPRVSLTVLTTAIILTMAVFNMVSQGARQAPPSRLLVPDAVGLSDLGRSSP